MRIPDSFPTHQGVSQVFEDQDENRKKISSVAFGIFLFVGILSTGYASSVFFKGCEHWDNPTINGELDPIIKAQLADSFTSLHLSGVAMVAGVIAYLFK